MLVRDSDTIFLVSVDPVLARGDLRAVLARLRENWPPARLVRLLASPHCAVAKTAAVCLGLTGSMEHCPELIALLGHADERVAAAAENGLWSVWMRAGSERGRAALMVAVQRLRAGQIEAALRLLRILVKVEGSFAEAHHQQAIALHSLERCDEAEAAYQKTLGLNPYHFAAVAGLGHICVERGDYAGALGHYRRAVQIHPRLAGVREIVPRLEAALERRVVA